MQSYLLFTGFFFKKSPFSEFWLGRSKTVRAGVFLQLRIADSKWPVLVIPQRKGRFYTWCCTQNLFVKNREGFSKAPVLLRGRLQVSPLPPARLPDLQLVGICTVQRSSEDSSVDVPIKSKFRQLCVSLRSCMSRPCWLSSFRFRFFPEAYKTHQIKENRAEKNPQGDTAESEAGIQL